MNQKTKAEYEGELVRPKSICVPLTSVDSEELSQAVKKDKSSRQLEATLRFHLKLFSRIPGDWAVAQKGEVQNKKITVILTARVSARLTEVANRAGRSRVQEATFRLHDHLRRIPDIKGDYWEITTL